MNIHTRLGTMVLGLVLAAVWAPRLPAGNPTPKVPDGPTVDFAKADKNGDGNISKEEALTVPDLTSAFEMLDSDTDALLSPAEFSRWDRAGKVEAPRPRDPATVPSGSAGSQHMPRPE